MYFCQVYGESTHNHVLTAKCINKLRVSSNYNYQCKVSKPAKSTQHPRIFQQDNIRPWAALITRVWFS